MADILSREIRLRRRPTGLPVEDDFELATVPIPELRAGELLVRNSYMSVDPYIRGRIDYGSGCAATLSDRRSADRWVCRAGRCLAE